MTMEVDMTIEQIECRTSAKAKIDAMGGVYYDCASPLEKFRVTSDSGSVYTVTRFANDETTGDAILDVWGCTCPAGSHHRLCKHVKAVINQIREA